MKKLSSEWIPLKKASDNQTIYLSKRGVSYIVITKDKKKKTVTIQSESSNKSYVVDWNRIVYAPIGC